MLYILIRSMQTHLYTYLFFGSIARRAYNYIAVMHFFKPVIVYRPVYTFIHSNLCRHACFFYTIMSICILCSFLHFVLYIVFYVI